MKIWPSQRTKEVSLTDAALDRAIRAGVQFPLEWFLSQPPEVQETIAARRDQWVEDVGVAMGYSIMDPELTRLALAAEDGDEQAEETLAELNAVAYAEELGRRVAAKGQEDAPSKTPLTMGGLGKRRQERLDKAEEDRRKGDLFGATEVRA